WAVDGATFRLDARTHFGAAVDAVLLVVEDRRRTSWRWGAYDALEARSPARYLGIVDGTLYSDLDAFQRTRRLAGRGEMEGRWGLNHDGAAVMELLRRHDGVLVNGLDETVDVEPDHLSPYRKGSDVANDRPAGNRFVLVTQRALGEDTERI